MKEVFVSNIITQKNALNFVTTTMVWEIYMNLCRHVFLNFPVFSQCLQMWFPSRWKWIFKIENRFLFLTSSCTKISLSFVTIVMVWEIQMNLCRYIFPNFLVFSQLFQILFPSWWKLIFKTWKSFLLPASSCTKAPFIFLTAIMVWDIQRDYKTLFFRISL